MLWKTWTNICKIIKVLVIPADNLMLVNAKASFPEHGTSVASPPDLQ